MISDSFGLHGRVAIVTGCNTGLGQAFPISHWRDSIEAASEPTFELGAAQQMDFTGEVSIGRITEQRDVLNGSYADAPSLSQSGLESFLEFSFGRRWNHGVVGPSHHG